MFSQFSYLPPGYYFLKYRVLHQGKTFCQIAVPVILLQEIKSKFRSINEIREAFEQFNLHQESDVEVMKRLVSIINNNTIANDDKHLALQDLEYYVHQVR